MSNDHDFDFQDDQSGTYPAVASTVKKNGHLVINGRPCEVVDLSKSESEVSFIGIDIFTGKKLEDSVEEDANVDIPYVQRKEYQFSYIDDGFLHLVKTDGTEKNDVRVPEGDLGDKIKAYEDSGADAVAIGVLSSLGEEAAISAKEVGNK